MRQICYNVYGLNQIQKQSLITFIRHEKEAPASRRAIAVSLLEAGVDVTMTGYTHKHAERLRREFLLRGVEVFTDKRKSNRERILNRLEKQQVILTLKTKRPVDVILGCSVQHWTTSLLGIYIYTAFGKKYKSKTSERLLFKEAKLTYHMPGKAYEKADPKARAEWISITKPLLTKLWQEPDTVILCEDEMILTSSTTIQKVWLPKGEYPPVLETNSTRKRKSFYGFLNLKTAQEHTFITDWQNMYITVDILKKLRKVYPTQKLILIWDNCGWHRGSKVTEWITADNNTETIYFPPYTPDLNPQEHVWKAGRKNVTHNQYIQKIEETAEKFKDYITKQKFNYELLGFKAQV